jgi:hypothetical protein
MTMPIKFHETSRSRFTQRFTRYMIKHGPNRRMPAGLSLPDYANNVAAMFWDENQLDCRSPEECAESDMNFWAVDFPVELPNYR